MDKIGIRTIVVNFDDEQLPYLSLVQGDAKTRGFDIVICDSDGKEIPPSDDYIVELVATGSNAPDTPYANRHTIKDGKYRVMIPTEALSESGFVFLQLVFYQKSTGAVIHTIEQKCPVYRSRGQEVVESNNLYVDITALRLGLERIDELDNRYESMLGEEKIRQDAEKKRNEQEANRIRDEKTRESNETIRKSQELSRKSAEDKRVTAEEQRKSNETQRIADENIRLEKEVTRQSEEAERQTAEDKRIADEKIRQSEENTRKSQETARQSAEDKRVTAETIRDDNEEIRKSNEVKREENEVTRIAQEKDRVIAEEERTKTFDGWDKTMEGIIPNATDISTGVVKIDKTEGEEAPYTVPTIGRLEEGMSAFEDRITADIQSFKDITVSENNALKEEITNSVDTKMTEVDSKILSSESKTEEKLNEVNGRLNTVESEVNRLSDIFSPVSPDDTSGSVGARTPIDYRAPLVPKYEKDFAFYGEVPSYSLINGTNLAAEVGLTTGYAINNNAGWLKYLYNGNVIFVSKKNIRNKLGWSDLDRAGLIYGDKTIVIKGFTYKIRLIRGIGVDAQKDPKRNLQYYDGKPCHNSEWNMLFCTLSDKLPYEWSSPENVSTHTPKLSVSYSDEELDMARGSWCQELIGGGYNRCGRGSVKDASLIYRWNKGNSADENGWRPVLQLVK